VGTVGLIKAVDRFDPARGAEFSTFATPTILGEIKRYFRDSSRAVHVPRRLQELHASVTKATETLTQSLGRSPTVREIAHDIGVTDDEVLEALEVRHAYAASSLDASAADGTSEHAVLADLIGDEDQALAAIEDRESLWPLLDALPDRERQIILLRFFRNQSQSQIAEQLGISQMHVSRLLARTLAELREGLAA
jgi:RNA polymerase sigma-B factor